MAVKTPEQLKQYLENGDEPDEEQFGDVLDSYWSKTQTIPITQIVVGEQVLACAPSTVWDFSQGGNAVLTIDQDTTLDLQNMEVGNLGILVIKQDAIGGWNIALPAGHMVGYLGAGVVQISLTPGSINTLTVYRSSVGYLWLHNKDFTAA